jgi:hypothetical protein
MAKRKRVKAATTAQPTSVTADTVLRVQERLNSDPQALADFLKDPSGYLEANGIPISAKYRDDLESSLREMRVGPRSFDSLASLKKKSISIGISVRIRF